MKKFLPVLLLAVSPVSSLALAQAQLVPKETKGATKGSVARADDCAPIGRTAKGELVYSLKCENLPAPPSPPPQAEVKEEPSPGPEVQRSGLFGWSYDRRD